MRTMTRIHGGQPLRSNRSVSSATQTPSRTWSWASWAAVQTFRGEQCEEFGVSGRQGEPAE